ncbi:MAG: sigma-54 dependent transcriptional regulator [Polyangiaceae bacterium]|jgi:two-component system response regulator HydG|nr:sigma-54 dependent transcriptional regulator [Polyangiaceae bacterium]
MGKILVVDDQRNVRATVAMMLRGAGHDVEEASDGAAGACAGAKGEFDVILTDLRMGRSNGMEVLRAVKDAQTMTEVIVMTAYGSIASAVEAMRLGAFDYLQKPFTEQELMGALGRALERRRLSAPLGPGVTLGLRDNAIIGRSPGIRDVLARIAKIAPTDATVLITGESGTGKEMVARAVHANSRRADKPFVPVNCAAITETLLESELFGHARGSFTGAVASRKGLFEEADGGTFFFDEIAETPPSFQAKLLRVIQEGEVRRIGENRPARVDVRIIAATNQDLGLAISEKRFRQDLYYRLNVARFQLPPLRERREDVPGLVDFFLDKYNRKMGARSRLGDGVLEALLRYDFPGNIRELENMVEQAVALSGGGLIGVEEIMPEVPISGPGADLRSLSAVVDAAERRAIELALRDCEGSRERAAEVLGISPTTLWRKMTRLRISFDQRHSA